jgi:hypothetical protein
MDTLTAAWLQVALAGLCLLSLALALVTALQLRASRANSEALGDSDTKTIVKVRLLESRVSELEASLAEIARSRASTDPDPEIVDLRTVFADGRQSDLASVVHVPDSD